MRRQECVRTHELTFMNCTSQIGSLNLTACTRYTIGESTTTPLALQEKIRNPEGARARKGGSTKKCRFPSYQVISPEIPTLAV